MCWLPQFAFDAKLTLDGLLAFVGGLVAVAVVWLATTKQIKDVRDREADRKREVLRSIAAGLLMEIDSFYRDRIRDRLLFLENRASKDDLVGIIPPCHDPFPVIGAAAGHLADLPSDICSVVVPFYADARTYVDALRQYARQLDMGSAGNTFASGYARTILGSFPESCRSLIQIVYPACGALCHFLGKEFVSPEIAVASDANVSDRSKELLTTIISHLVPLESAG